MGLGQTMLTTLFLVLLTLAVISANRLILNSESSFYEQEAYKESGLLANALLQEIVRKKFDSKVADTSAWGYMDSTSFDSPGSLGAPSTARSNVNPSGVPDTFPYKSIDNSNSILNFDDIDDYKGYKRSANAGSLTGFILTVDVYYVRWSTPNSISNIRTYRKRIDVLVSNPKYLKKDLMFSTIAAY